MICIDVIIIHNIPSVLIPPSDMTVSSTPTMPSDVSSVSTPTLYQVHIRCPHEATLLSNTIIIPYKLQPHFTATVYPPMHLHHTDPDIFILNAL